MTTIDLSGQFLWDSPTEAALRSQLTPRMRVLNLSTCHVGRGSTALITAALTAADSAVEALVLDQCRLSVSSACALFAALPSSRVRHLSLDRNVLTRDACAAFAAALSAGAPLEFASLRWCDIPADGCCDIADALPRAQSLRVLALDGNCAFDRGAEALARALSLGAPLEELSLGANHVWRAGTDALADALAGGARLRALDVSRNIVDLPRLAASVLASELRALSVSGCKAAPAQVLPFLDAIADAPLEMLAIEGLDLGSQLPIAWPRVRDDLCALPGFVGRLLAAEHLSDVRVGFLSLVAMRQVRAQCRRAASFSMSDFGRSGDTWVLRAPEFALEAPARALRWAAPLDAADAPLLAELFCGARCGGEPLDAIDVSGAVMSDDALRALLGALGGAEVRALDASDSALTDAVADVIAQFAERARLRELRLQRAQLTERGCAALFVRAPPQCVDVSFTGECGERDEHAFAAPLSARVAENCALAELVLRGPVTAADMACVFADLRRNSNLRRVRIEAEIPSKYRVPEPELDSGVQEDFCSMVRALSDALSGEDTVCALESFSFPLFQKVYLYCDTILGMWGAIEAQMEANKNRNVDLC